MYRRGRVSRAGRAPFAFRVGRIPLYPSPTALCRRENVGSPKRRIYKSSLQESTTTETQQNSKYIYSPAGASGAERRDRSCDVSTRAIGEARRDEEKMSLFCRFSAAEITTRTTTTTTTRGRTETEKNVASKCLSSVCICTAIV